MTRLTAFAKANSDVADVLFGCADPTGKWGGLNEIFRAGQLSHRMRLIHETSIGSRALLESSGQIPPDLKHCEMAPPYTLASQFSVRMFEERADFFALSLQPDVNVKLMRHRQSGALFHPLSLRGDLDTLRAWLKSDCEAVGFRSAAQTMEDLGQIIDRVRIRNPTAPIFVMNLSEFIAGDNIFRLGNLSQTLPMRIKQFNLAALELTRRPGVCLIDVNRVLAEHGAAKLKLDAVRVNSAGSRLIANEWFRIMGEIGLI